MELRHEFFFYGEAFLRLFYPGLCASCNRLLELEERGLCTVCLEDLLKFKLEPSEERIRTTVRATSEGWAIFRYEGLVKEVLRKVKFEGRRDLLRAFYPEIAQFLSRRAPLATYDCLLPVPLDSHRRLEREFNQSGLLAKRIHRFLERSPRLLTRTLIRKHSPLPQSLLGREARRVNVSHAFSIPNGRAVRGRSVLIIDDIFTTGATIEEIARVLRSAGASRVGYLTLARTAAH